YGADAARWFILSDSPPERDVEWTDAGAAGAWKLVARIWEAVEPHKNALANRDLIAAPAGAHADLRRATHATIAAVTEDIEHFRFNKAIARIYEFLNAFKKAGDADDWTRAEALSALVRLIAPITPHLAEECWERLGGEGLVCRAPWPTAEAGLLKKDEIIL